jgi:hypothetical protein
MIKEILIKKFGTHINHMSCVYLGDGENVLRNMCTRIKNRKSCLEIGTYQGVSACVLSEYFEDVLTIDIEKQPLTTQIIEYGKVGNITAVLVKNRKDEDAIIKKAFTSPIQLVFIDGEHFNGELKKDWESVNEHCDNILIHDYSPFFSEVYDFVNEKSKKGWNLHVEGTFALLTRSEEAPKEKVKKKRKPRIKSTKK